MAHRSAIDSGNMRAAPRFRAPRGGEGLLERGLDARDVNAQPVAVLKFEILYPGRATVRPGELVGPLGDDPQAEVLEHRQEVGDRNRFAELGDLQVQSAG